MRFRPIEDQVIVVTGASSGIGRATALMAAGRGAKVVLAARGEDALAATNQELTAVGGEALVVPTDVTDFTQVEELGRRAVARFGRIDTWVNNASVSVYAEFADVTPEEFGRVLDVNVMGTVHGAKVALGHLREHGGSIVNVSSGLGDRAVPLQSAYCAAKHAVNGFGDALRVELAHAGLPVQVVTIKPGSIDTPFFDHARTKMGVRPKPVPPVYDPDVVAEAILHAATHPTRDLPVGGASAGISTLERLSPRAMDWQLRLVGYASQQTDQPKPESAPDNLFEGSPGPGSIRGGHGGRRVSVYTRLRRHPGVRLGALGGAAAAGGLTLARRGRSA